MIQDVRMVTEEGVILLVEAASCSVGHVIVLQSGIPQGLFRIYLLEHNITLSAPLRLKPLATSMES